MDKVMKEKLQFAVRFHNFVLETGLNPVVATEIILIARQAKAEWEAYNNTPGESQERYIFTRRRLEGYASIDGFSVKWDSIVPRLCKRGDEFTVPGVCD